MENTVALAENLPVYKASYDLLLSIFNLAGNFRKETVTAVKNIYRANCTKADDQVE